LKFARELYLNYFDTKIAKYVEHMRAFHLLERLLFCEGVTNKKTHFKSHVLASPVQLATTDALKKAGLAFDQSRVSTKCPQEGNGVKLST